MLAEQLEGLSAKIQEICQAAGNAGLSLGVIKDRRIIHQAHFGLRSISAGPVPDGGTIYHLGSLSKALTAAGLATLVEDGRLQWDSCLSEILPEWHQKNKEIEAKATITDLLAHRMGLGMRMNYWAQMEQELLVPADAAIDVLGALSQTADFRATMKYNNWTYSVAGLIIERYSGMPLDEFMHSRFFEPLGLRRTTFGKVVDDNYASCHITLSDGTPFEVPRPQIASGTVMAAAAGLKSSTEDLLVIYGSMLEALEDQRKTGLTSSPNSPFKQMMYMLTSHNKKGSTEYGLGWFLVDLPSELGWIGINDGRVAKNPTIARGVPPTQVAYHNGSMPGILSSVHLIPSTKTAIVVLSNTLAFADVPDYVGSLILEQLLDGAEMTDYLPLVQEAKNVSLTGPQTTIRKLEAKRKSGTSHKPLTQYEGRYVNPEHTFFLDIKQNGDGLRMNVQSLPQTYYDLHHYHDDVFAWRCDRDEEAKRAMFPQLSDDFRKVNFQTDEDEQIARIWWVYARDEPAGETFTKMPAGKL